jgi:chemotaxis-related protein WspD
MNDQADITGRASPAVAADCWTTIGVRGDRSCQELIEHVHCRNCPVYASRARQLLDAEVPLEYLARSTSHYAHPKPLKALDTQSIVIFRIGAEWLALPTSCVTEVVNVLPIHSVPHRPSGTILGLASVRGALLVCVSLGGMLGLPPSTESDHKARRTAHPRLLVIRAEQIRAVCPVDEVHGIHRFHPRELKDVPATVARATATYSKSVLPWQDRSVGLLDDGLVFHTLKRSVA